VDRSAAPFGGKGIKLKPVGTNPRRMRKIRYHFNQALIPSSLKETARIEATRVNLNEQYGLRMTKKGVANQRFKSWEFLGVMTAYRDDCPRKKRLLPYFLNLKYQVKT